MKHYDLTPESKKLISDAELEAFKAKMRQNKNNVDKAEAVVRALELSDFELHILARRLSGEWDLV